MKFGYIICGPPPSESVELGILAEECGFDFVWIPDHLVDLDGCKVDPWTVMSYIAANTNRIRFAPAVTDFQRCHPAKIAHIVATLDNLSNGRVALGIGAGEAMNIIPYGIQWEDPETRLRRLYEGIEVFRALLLSSRDNSVSYSGKIYSLKNAFLDLSPIQRPPPVYVGALSANALKIAAQLQSGWLTWIITPKIFKKRLERVKRETGKDVPEKVVWLYVAFASDEKEYNRALDIAKALLVVERTILKRLGYDIPKELSGQHSLATQSNLKKIIELSKRVPEDIVRECFCVGGVENCVEFIENYRRAGAHQLAIRDISQNTRKTLQIFKEKIIPLYK